MYLTRLRLDPRSAMARRDLAEPYEMHRTLVRAFVTDAEQTPPRILWRADVIKGWSSPILLVQSQEMGDWSVLDTLPHYLSTPVETREWEPASWLRDDALFRFRLAANPTVTRDGKRLGLISEEAQLSWLERQGDRFGFDVEAALVTGHELLRTRKGSSFITVLRVCFEGRFRVQDRTTLAQAVRAGIGPAKALGCGLLSLGRLR